MSHLVLDWLVPGFELNPIPQGVRKNRGGTSIGWESIGQACQGPWCVPCHCKMDKDRAVFCFLSSSLSSLWIYHIAV